MTLLEELQAVAIERDGLNGWQRRTVDELAEWRDPELLRPWARAYLGPRALTIRDTRTRLVVGERVSAGEIGRHYLRLAMSQAAEESGRANLAKRVPHSREMRGALDDVGPPYYFAGECGGPFALVDISACYASIYARLTLDMTVRFDTTPPLLGLGRIRFPRVAEWMEAKGPRNAAWGNLLRPAVTEWRHASPTGRLPNRFFAPDLALVVLSVINAIAQESVERFGFVSWSVDGGCTRPPDLAPAWAEWLWERWALRASLRAEGPGWVFGANSWRVGPLATADVEHGTAHVWRPMSTIRPVALDVRDRLAWLMRERGST